MFRQLGQLFMMGFDGTAVNDQVRMLICTYHVGSILLTAKNFECILFDYLRLRWIVLTSFQLFLRQYSSY